ncbi:MAG: hypothetical protein ACRDJN_17480 [Chloroflexota bacterium]
MAPRSRATLWEAYRTWRAAAGPLADYILPEPFLAPQESAPRPPAYAGAAAIATRIGARAAQGGAALFFEASPRVALAVGGRLSQAGWTVAPLFGRWPAPDAVLPVTRLTGWLTYTAKQFELRSPGGDPSKLQRPTSNWGPRVVAARATDKRHGPHDGDAPRRLCLLLDAERGRKASAQTLRRRFDNRYDYDAYQFPPAGRWLAWGVRHALWIGPAAAVPPDMEPYAETLVAAGMTVELVSLRALCAR